MQSLLELLSVQMGCRYLSDLRFLSPEQRCRLAQKLTALPAREDKVRDWNAALTYLSGAPPEKTARAAKEHLLRSLTRSCGKAAG